MSQDKDFVDISIDLSDEEWNDIINTWIDKYSEEKKIRNVLNVLEIPIEQDGHGPGYHVHIKALYEIFMNPEKCAKLVSKLRNKAFW